MALEPIRPKDLPPAVTVFATDSIPVDNGASVSRGTPVQIADAGAPIASKAEAIAGVNAVKRMTPLTTRQVLDNELAPPVALAQAWAESPTPPDPLYPTSKSSKTWAAAAADSAVSAEASAATVAGDVDQIIAYIGAQLQTVNTFTSIPQFETYDATFSYWLLNSVVQAGGVDFQKRSVSNGDVVANAWVALGYADKLLDGYLPKASGVVKHHHIANMPAFTLLANDLAVSAAPFPVTYEKALSTMGVHSYGDTESGGISAPLSSTVPNAPNGLRCGRGTSSAGETTVTFSNEFAPCIPNVMISPQIVGSGAASLFAMLTEEPTVTGFKFIIRNAVGTAVAAPYHFIAMGQDD